MCIRDRHTANHAICQTLGDDIETALETLAGEQGETLAAEQKDQLIDLYQSQHTQPLVEQRDLFIGLNPEDAKALQAAATPSQQPQHPVRLHQATGYTEALNAQEHDEHQDGYGAFLPQEAWDSYQQNQQTAWEEWATVWRDKQQTDAPSRWIPSFNTKTHIINCTGGKDTTQNEGKTGCQSNNGNNIEGNEGNTGNGQGGGNGNDEARNSPVDQTVHLMNRAMDRQQAENQEPFTIRFSAKMILDKQLLSRKIAAVYAKYGGELWLPTEDIRGEFPLAIRKLVIHCFRGNRIERNLADYHKATQKIIMRIRGEPSSSCQFQVSLDTPIPELKHHTFMHPNVSWRNKYYSRVKDLTFNYQLPNEFRNLYDFKLQIKEVSDYALRYDSFTNLTRGNSSWVSLFLKVNHNFLQEDFLIRYSYQNYKVKTQVKPFSQNFQMLSETMVFDNQFAWKEHDAMRYIIENHQIDIANHLYLKDRGGLMKNPPDSLFSYQVLKLPWEDIVAKSLNNIVDSKIEDGNAGMHIVYVPPIELNQQSIFASSSFGVCPGHFLEKAFSYIRQAKLNDKTDYYWGWATNLNKDQKDQLSGIDYFESGIPKLAGLIYLTDTYIKPKSTKKWDGFSTTTIDYTYGTFDWFKDNLKFFVDDKIYIHRTAHSIFKRVKLMSQEKPLSNIVLHAMLAGIDDTIRQTKKIKAEVFENKLSFNLPFDTRRYHYNFQNNIEHYLSNIEHHQNIGESYNINLMTIKDQEAEAMLHKDCVGPLVLCIKKSGAIKVYFDRVSNMEMASLNFPQTIGKYFSTSRPLINDIALLNPTYNTKLLSRLLGKPFFHSITILGNKLNHPQKQDLLGWGSLLNDYMSENYQTTEGYDNQLQALFGTSLDLYHAFATEKSAYVYQIKQTPITIYAINEKKILQYLGKFYRGDK